jgi:predicted small lipoprotein YifL
MRPLNLRHGLGAFILALALAGCGGSGPEPAETAPPEQAAPNFVHLQSDPGDEIGQGRSYTYTSGTADIAVRVQDGRLAVRVGGSEAWAGEFPLQDVQQGKLRPGLMARPG